MIERLEAEAIAHYLIEVTSDDLLPLIAVAKAAKESKLAKFHMDTCDKALTCDEAYTCNCGHDALCAAFAALEPEGERG